MYSISGVSVRRRKKKASSQKVITENEKNRYSSPFGWLNRGTSLSHSANGIDILDIIKRCRSETEVLRILNRHSAVFSTAVFNLVEIALEDLYVVSKHPDGSFSPVTTKIASSLLQKIFSPDTNMRGYTPSRSSQSVMASMIQETILSGGVFVEAVPTANKTGIKEVSLIPLEILDFKEVAKTVLPFHDGKPLDYPNMFYSSLHQQANSYKASSMMTPAVGTTLAFSDFVSSMNKALDRAGHSRLVVYLNKDQYLGLAPDECSDNPANLEKWLETNRTAIANILSELAPEDALVMYDDQKADILEGTDVKSDYSDLLNTMAGILALSLKSHPSILGLRIGGSQSLSNIEALTYLHIAKGLQRPVEDVISKILTFSLRLIGSKDTVVAKFKEINLRPETELETHYLTRQTRLLSLLSLGIITDEEFFIRMGLGSPPDGYTSLSGTNFMKVSGNVPATGGISNSQDGGAGHTINPSSRKHKS